MTTSSSNVKPSTIEPDMGSLTSDGHICVLVHWNINSVSKTDDQGTAYSSYEYQEERITTLLPSGVRSGTDITAYLETQKNRLLLLAGSDTILDRLTATEDLIAAVVEGSV